MNSPVDSTPTVDPGAVLAVQSAPYPGATTAPTRGIIEVRDFTKCYGEFVAVDQLSFTIGEGEIFGFIGPNGAGKSTTIRFLATLLRPTSGSAFVAGHSVVDDPMGVRRVIGFMPDDFGVYDGMKVWEFLDFFAVAYEIPRARRRTIINDVLNLVDLTHKRDDFVNGLSKGMKQRLCLAKTLVHDPPVLILDEPASGLDPRARVEMKALLVELSRMGKTILISSHILSELADFCTMIGVIERGRLLACGGIQHIQRQIQAHRILKIRILDPEPTRARDLLESHPGLTILDFAPGPRAFTCEFQGDDQQFADLLELLFKGGVRVHSFAEEELSLEEVFMRITKGIVN
ncbi:ABC transporter related protein [Isosphaera pallida ATCC 43644]|uniref:ABC transporter related protein n=1 Tax=Isosphaera pallida (strain ATCC 43644 / DSM 9630 / IS1B) TaxID=575540 RepID=E8R218_ISOPI|nr:ABC transporter ATP-binding protein [Isosphaera pallida]ADV62450.1 ABC transporter related protein [Isosphaera pallida ATCC 43644]